jgi:putative PIN family toxin of toxin-antitoxin system
MGAQTKVLRAVLDTNAAVSALVFDHGVMAWLRHAWQRRLFTPLIDEYGIRELLRVLNYPKFKLDEQKIRDLLGDYLPYAEVIVSSGRGQSRLPVCRDPDDQPFLFLAEAGNADVLISGDKALLDLNGRTKFGIETAASFRRRFEGAT